MPGQEVVMDDQEQSQAPQEKPVEQPKEAQYAPIDKLEEQRQKLERIEKQLNGLSYIGRKFDELSRKIESYPTYQPQAQQKSTQPQDELDELVQTDWKKAVRKLAQEEAKAMRETERAEEMRQRMIEQQRNILEENKRKVLDKYPEINDQNSDVAQHYLRVVQKNPSYLNNEYGPLLAMRDMEEELRSEGKLDNQSKQVVQKEVQRQTRASATAAPTKGKAPSSSGDNSLSSEDLKLCKENGINPDLYLKMKRSMTLERQAEAS